MRNAEGRTIVLERTYRARVEDVWALWTTKHGIESWWGPEGFTTTVHSLDLRRGGEWRYTMAATAPDTMAWMRNAGRPLAHYVLVTYVEIVPLRRLRYTNRMDFIPGVKSYNVDHLVELSVQAGEVRMVITVDPLHDATWTELSRQGFEGQLGRLARVLSV
jgi:uncharacterized protein YndB with AHSA1/START domain